MITQHPKAIMTSQTGIIKYQGNEILLKWGGQDKAIFLYYDIILLF
jgi:hypothetical protein